MISSQTEQSRHIDNKILIFVPTYNERENAPNLFRELIGLGLDADLLFVDDNSPDGTGKLLDELAKQYPRLKVLHRPGKLGIGSAHYDGIMWAYANEYSEFVSLDADFTHRPQDILRVLKTAQEMDCDVVIGSRYMVGGSLPGWNIARRSLTNLGHLATQLFLGMRLDATGALRYYRLDRIPRHAFDLVRSKGYSFFFESLYILFYNKFRIIEIPISLPARTYGSSKMDLREVLRSIKLLTITCFTKIFNPEKYQIGQPLRADEINSSQHDNQGWEEYWQIKKSGGGLLYDAIASLYRKFLIRPSLNLFIRSKFTQGASVLHAGCGGGQVDTDISSFISITALDISVNALNAYRNLHRGNCVVLHGSILDIPAADESFDGIYNLGVMEHFTRADICQILKEFKRVLRPGGRIILFWPPEFGVSVLFFKGLSWIYKNILRKKNVKFHPDEITRLKSKSHAQEIFQNSGLVMIDYYFGWRDLYTQAVIMAEKPQSQKKILTDILSFNGSSAANG